MKLKNAFMAALCLAAPCVCQAFEFTPDKLEDIISRQDLFSIPSDSFIDAKKDKVLISWLTAKKDEAHYPAYPGQSPKMSFFGADVQEATFRFKGDKLDNIYISLYNRGDAGRMDMDTFTAQTASLAEKFDSSFGVKGVELKKSKLNSSTSTQAKAWVKDSLGIVLKWNYSGKSKSDYKPEYIQLTIEKFNPKDDPRKRSSVGDLRAGMSTAKELPQNLSRDKEEPGDVHIENIPMIDQGQKGYCVDASVARVLRYYGVDVTQHDIAQIAEADAERGTNAKIMIAAIKKVSTRYGVKVREYYKNEVELIDDARDVERYVKKYNTTAKKLKRQTVKMVVRGNMIYVGDTIAQMEQEIIIKNRLDDKDGQKNFIKDIKACIDKGIPVLWGVKLGIVKEKEIPQADGYHMRLITGYNEKSGQFIYSDSWGAKHDVKRLSYEDIWTMTNFTLTLDPLK